MLDEEIVLVRGSSLDFEVLQQRIHPAASRVKLLAAEIPASVVFFDMLCDGERDLRGVPFRERRALLEARLGGAKPPIHLTPATTDRALAADWFKRVRGGRPGRRDGQAGGRPLRAEQAGHVQGEARA